MLVTISTGEYSDYSVSDPVRVVRAFRKGAVAAEFEARWVPQEWETWREKPSPGDFLPFLVKAGYVEAVDNCHEWHVGSYGDFKP